MSFTDLSYEIKKKEIFPNYMTYSLKKLSNKLREKYRSNFPESYDELDIKNGENAFMELISYYNCKDEKKELIKENIEKYNKIDCVLMYRIVEWLGNSKKKIVL
jgi:predicted RecB family nuclease